MKVVEDELPGEGSHYKKLLVQAAAGTLPDLTFMQGGNDYVSFAAKGLLMPLEHLIKQDRAFDQSTRLHPRAREIVELLGHVWGLPVEAGTFVVFYNKNLFGEAGVPFPSRGWVWNDLLDYAKRLTRTAGEKRQFGYGQGSAFDRIEPWIVQRGTRAFDPVNFPTKQQLDTAPVIDAVGFVHDLAWKHRVMDTSADAYKQGVGLWQGDQAMRQEGIWMIPDLAKNMKSPWGMAPLPKGEREATWMSIDLNVAFKDTKHPAVAYDFLKFINLEGQKPMIELWGRMPVTRTDQNKQVFIDYLKQFGVNDWQIAWDAWDSGYTSHLTPAWPDLDQQVLAPAFKTFFGAQGANSNVATTLKSVAPQAQEILNREGQLSQ